MYSEKTNDVEREALERVGYFGGIWSAVS